MDRQHNVGKCIPSEYITNTASSDNNVDRIPVPPNSNGWPRQTISDEQKKDIRNARARARYVKKNPIPKRARKDSQPLPDASQGVSTDIMAIESTVTHDRVVVETDNSGKKNAEPVDSASWLRCDDSYKRRRALTVLAETVPDEEGMLDLTIQSDGIISVFSHGQLYVALSRATVRQHIKVLTYPADHYTRVKGAKIKGVSGPKGKNRTRKDKIKEACEKSNGGTYTKNIVYKEVLT